MRGLWKRPWERIHSHQTLKDRKDLIRQKLEEEVFDTQRAVAQS